MLDISQETLNIINSPVRQIKARVELYNNAGIEADGSTLEKVFTHDGALINFTVDRVGDESKFFGFGVFQKINLHLIDINRELNITTTHYLRVVYEIGEEEIIPYPFFKVSEVHRDENTNELSITGYDLLNDTKTLAAPIEEMKALIETNNAKTDAAYTKPNEFMFLFSKLLFSTNGLCGTLGGIMLKFHDITEINLDGSETFKDVLDALAEITHSIYFLNGDNRLYFKAIYDDMVDGYDTIEINKNNYFTLETKENRRLSTVIHTTELNDNVSATTGSTGTTQYMKSNPFIELNIENVALIVDDIIANMGDFTINQFECEWRGNPAVEIGDKLAIAAKDGSIVNSRVINDTVEYNGTLTQTTSWNYIEDAEDAAGTPSTIGEALKQTLAKIDKVNNEITLLAQTTKEDINNVSGEVEELTKSVEAKLDTESFEIKITEAIKGVNSITTTTGFTFSEDGLNISKTDSDISTLIDEDGMDISKGDEKVLTADNSGVNAINLTAKKYLIIGNYSRFEDFGERTGCFWIGG